MEKPLRAAYLGSHPLHPDGVSLMRPVLLEITKLVDSQSGLFQNCGKSLRLDRAVVARNGGSSSGGVAQPPMAPAGSSRYKTAPQQSAKDLSAGNSRQSRQKTASTCEPDLNSLQARARVTLGNRKALLGEIFQTKSHRITGVVERLFHGIPLGNNPRQSRDDCRVAASFVVGLQHDGVGSCELHGAGFNGPDGRALRFNGAAHFRTRRVTAVRTHPTRLLFNGDPALCCV